MMSPQIDQRSISQSFIQNGNILEGKKIKTKEMQVPKQVSYTARLFEMEEKIRMAEGMHPKRPCVACGTDNLKRNPTSRKQWDINQHFKKIEAYVEYGREF